MYRYAGTWGTPSTRPMTITFGQNLRKLKAELREICHGNLLEKESGYVRIWLNGKPYHLVYDGIIH